LSARALLHKDLRQVSYDSLSPCICYDMNEGMVMALA